PPYQQFELVIVYRALPADHGTYGPHRPQRRVGVEAHRVARGPATPPAVATDREVRLAGQGVDGRTVGRGVAGADHAQPLFHHVERRGTGEHQRPLARDAAGIGDDRRVAQAVVLRGGGVALRRIRPIGRALAPGLLGEPG